MKELLFLMSAIFFLSACGQSGPLYLPKDHDKPVATNNVADQSSASLVDQSKASSQTK